MVGAGNAKRGVLAPTAATVPAHAVPATVRARQSTEIAAFTATSASRPSGSADYTSTVATTALAPTTFPAATVGAAFAEFSTHASHCAAALAAAAMASALIASVGTLRWLFKPFGRRRRHRRLPRRLLPTCGRQHLVPLVEKWREVSQKIWVESVSVTESVVIVRCGGVLPFEAFASFCESRRASGGTHLDRHRMPPPRTVPRVRGVTLTHA